MDRWHQSMAEWSTHQCSSKWWFCEFSEEGKEQASKYILTYAFPRQESHFKKKKNSAQVNSILFNDS